ncbi:MAG TPA: 16S rRNA (cytosine(967)-C(5))-methyltransferase RsmB [Lachnospiraceae bacterium]|nr:16S rRNA (cytosine(967)-C(5))-methyltransferase RsmB [Lachnospiraceae bacterium]
MGAVNNREIVLDMLLLIEKQEAFSNQLIKDVLNKYDYLSGQEKAFIKRLFEGTLERQIELDFDLNQISSVPVRKMKPLIRSLLRMSAYQILFMDGVPDAAAVSEAVKLTGKRKFQNLKGYVNGVLRNLTSNKDKLKTPDEKTEPFQYLSVVYSMPEWIVQHFLSIYSYEETKNLLECLLKVRPVCIRFSKRLADKEKEDLIEAFALRKVNIRKHPFISDAYYLENSENIATLPGFLEGKFTVQDASSMAAVDAADIKPGALVLDICAAPGGKTMLAAEYTGEDGRVISRDVSQYKTSLIEENITRMRLKNVIVQVWDARVPDEEMQNKADVVLADVPCSGLGVIGRKRDIKYRLKPEALQEILVLQKEILRQSVTYVKQGGTLLFSTCTINPDENERTADWICKEFDFIKEKEMQLLPNHQDTDGFYFAKMRRK